MEYTTEGPVDPENVDESAPMTEHDQDSAGGQAFDAKAFVQEWRWRFFEWAGTGVQVKEMQAGDGEIDLAQKAYESGLAASRVTPEPAALRELAGELIDVAVEQLEKDCGAAINALSDKLPESAMKNEARSRLALWKSNIRFACVNYVRAALAADKPAGKPEDPKHDS